MEYVYELHAPGITLSSQIAFSKRLAIYIYKQGSQATPLFSVPNSKKSKESTAYDSGWSTSFP
jgi:hypothetical protein